MTQNVLDFTTPVPCWCLLEWTDYGGVRILGVYSTYGLAAAAKGDKIDPRRMIVDSEYYSVLDLPARTVTASALSTSVSPSGTETT